MAAAGLQELGRFFFRPEGRIGRMEYCLGAGLITALNLAILSALYLHTDGTPGVLMAAALIGFPMTVALLFVVAKRCHDFGLPGSFVLLVVVPGVGLFWLVALAVIPGDARPNLYGAPPRFRPD
jgi:uncharacterized membrane protein YhaH (DUF805 family)